MQERLQSLPFYFLSLFVSLWKFTDVQKTKPKALTVMWSMMSHPLLHHTVSQMTVGFIISWGFQGTFSFFVVADDI